MTATATREVTRGPVPAVAGAGAGRVSRTARWLGLMMAILVGLGLATGVSGVTSVQSRAAAINEMETRSGPLVVAAQDLYRSLSDADATVASAFLADGPEPPELRERYQAGVANAGSALARISSGVNQGEAADAVAVLSVQLPVYTGLVETARAYHRQGLPVGAAYLREASGVMREQLLPAAERLFDALSEQLADTRSSAGGFPIFAVLLGLVTVGFLVVFQVQLAGRTNRIFNVGLVVATVVALAALLWLGVSWSVSASHLDASDREGSAQIGVLSQARIAALQARSDEAHTLVARGAGEAYEENFQTLMARLTGEGEGAGAGLLPAARAQAADDRAVVAAAEAMTAAVQWQETHAEVRRLDDVEGDYAGAVALAVGDGADSSATAAARLDGALADGITHGSERLADGAYRAGRALGGAGLGLGLLTALLLAGVVVGIQQRLAEYR